MLLAVCVCVHVEVVCVHVSVCMCVPAHTQESAWVGLVIQNLLSITQGL